MVGTSGAANQRWNIVGNTIRVFGKCLEAPVNAAAGARARLWDCNGGTNQQWSFGGNGTINGVASGLCLDVTGNGTANGTTVGLWTCNNQANQRWARL